MDLLENIKDIMLNASSFEKNKNYYFQNHICKKTGNNIKINLDFKLSNDNTDKIMKFGICKECNKVFYYYDFESSSF